MPAERAVAEMFRTVRSNGIVYAATPFLQSYHGYPDNYQNFTLRGTDDFSNALVS